MKENFCRPVAHRRQVIHKFKRAKIYERNKAKKQKTKTKMKQDGSNNDRYAFG